MKIRVLFVLFLVMAFVLSACGPADVEEPGVPEPVVEEPVIEEPVVEEPVVEEPEVEEPEVEEPVVEDPIADVVELRFMYYGDGVEPDVMQSIVAEFMAQNEDIMVMLDVVPYSTVDEQLPIQVEAGQGPDIARITNFAAFKGQLLDLREYVSDPDYYVANFPLPILEAIDFGGFTDQYTVTAPFVNQTLFEQAGIDLPGEDATWDDWAEVTAQVAEATGTPYAIGIDRTGHRFAGPAISMGATILDSEGNFTIDTPEFRSFVEMLKSWYEAGLTPGELYLTGEAVASCMDWFKTADMVMCMTGSWHIAGTAVDVGDAFDWLVVPNPSGEGGSTGIAGGSALVAFADTEHADEVTRFLEFLYTPENYATWSAGTLNLPAQVEAAEIGVNFDSDDPSVLAALSAFTAEVPKLQDQAISLNIHPFAFIFYRSSANRVEQYLAGELTLDQTIENIQMDIDQAIEEAGQ